LGPRPSRFSIVAVIALAIACGKSGAAITPNTQGWWRDKVVYEVFVRSFADSNGDGIGDLPGVTAHLGDLRDLGVDAIWLTPIFPSPSYHGYDVTDYRGVNPAYGTLADFDALVAAAHQKGIKVILDMVLNHSSSNHPWFVNARQGADAQYRNWYDWSATDPGWRKPWDSTSAWYAAGGAFYYGIFCPCMPDLNLGNPAVEQELTDSMQFWLARGTDGFRLDAVRYFFESATGKLADQPETHAFLRRVRARLQQNHPDALLVAEAWASESIAATYYGNGDEVQLAFAFDAADAIKSSIRKGVGSDAINALASSQAALAGKDLGFLAPFLANHDMQRALREMGGDPAQAHVAAATLFALPGTPFVYYGEEIGMMGGAGSDDTNKRTAMHWTSSAPGYGFTTGSPWNASAESVDVASQRADPQSLWSEYKNLIALRHAQTALTSGDMTFPASSGPSSVFAMLRTSGAQRVLFVANFASSGAPSFDVTVPGTPSLLTQEGLAGAPSASNGKVSFAGLGPRSFAYVSLN
jgi:glycosidase